MTIPEFAELLAGSEIFEDVVPAPPAQDTWNFGRSLYQLFPDYWISFDDSGATDVEAKAARCPERFGIQRGGAQRKRLNRLWTVPPVLDEALEHRSAIFERYFRHFGIEGEINWAPVDFGIPPTSMEVGHVFFAAQDSGAMDADRWPDASWQELIARCGRDATHPSLVLSSLRIVSTETQIVPEDISWAGLAGYMASCGLLVTDDLELLHLAGALGVPAIGLFGTVNSLREGPVFSASAWIVRPPECPESGGVPLSKLEPGTVFERMLAVLSAAAQL